MTDEACIRILQEIKEGSHRTERVALERGIEAIEKLNAVRGWLTDTRRELLCEACDPGNE